MYEACAAYSGSGAMCCLRGAAVSELRVPVKVGFMLKTFNLIPTWVRALPGCQGGLRRVGGRFKILEGWLGLLLCCVL